MTQVALTFGSGSPYFVVAPKAISLADLHQNLVTQQKDDDDNSFEAATRTLNKSLEEAERKQRDTETMLAKVKIALDQAQQKAPTSKAELEEMEALAIKKATLQQNIQWEKGEELYKAMDQIKFIS